jgi:hypothetical protein
VGRLEVIVESSAFTRAHAVASACQCKPLLIFQRVGEILKGPEQIVEPEEGGIGRDSSGRFAVLGIAYGAGSGANLFGNLIDRKMPAQPGGAKVPSEPPQSLFDWVRLGFQQSISAHFSTLKSSLSHLIRF